MSLRGSMKSTKKATGGQKPRKTVPKSQNKKPLVVAATSGRQITSRVGPKVHTESGRLYLGPLQAGASPVAGDLLMQFEIYPGMVAPSRLAQLAGMYSRYRLKKARITYETAVGSTTDGSLFGWIDSDPVAPIPTASSLGEVVMAHRSAAVFPVWMEASFDFLPSQKDKWFYTTVGSETRDYAAGILRFASDVVLTANKTYGRVYMDYVVEFTEDSLTSAAATLVVAGSGQTSGKTLTNGQIYRLIEDLFPSSATADTLCDTLKVGTAVNGQSGIKLPAGSYVLECTARPNGNATSTNNYAWNQPSVRTYDPVSGSETTATVESVASVDNTSTPNTQKAYTSTFKAMVELISESLVDLSAAWVGDTYASYTVDQDWFVTTVAPLALKTAAAFLTSSPHPAVSVKIGPTRKVQVSVTDKARVDRHYLKAAKAAMPADDHEYTIEEESAILARLATERLVAATSAARSRLQLH